MSSKRQARHSRNKQLSSFEYPSTDLERRCSTFNSILRDAAQQNDNWDEDTGTGNLDGQNVKSRSDCRDADDAHYDAATNADQGNQAPRQVDLEPIDFEALADVVQRVLRMGITGVLKQKIPNSRIVKEGLKYNKAILVFCPGVGEIMKLTRMLTDSGAVRGLELMMDSGLLSVILPEVAQLRGVDQPPEFHPEGDVWTHLLLVMGQLDRPTPELAWAALLHDIGKEPTFEVRDRIRFNRHDVVGAKMAEAICRRLRMSNARTERIVELVAQHMRIRNAPDMRESTRRRFLRQDCFSQLLELHRADCMGCHGKLDLYEYCMAQLALLSEEQLRPPRLLSGRDLLELGLQPGPLVGRILDRLEEAQLEGNVESRDQALAWVCSRYGASFKTSR